MDGMYNFKTGDGKSPSFFFFTDNKKIMMKTLKESEFEIIFDKEFITKYFQHIMLYPKSLLSKIYGVYQVCVAGKSPIYFFLTDNMVEKDAPRIYRQFDLKGSTYGRETKVPEIKKNRSGMMVLKDLNLMDIKE